MTTDLDVHRQEDEVQQFPYDEMDEELFEPYRTLSKAALGSLLFAIFTLAGLVFPALLGGALIAIILGVVGLRGIRRYPRELTGTRAAITGIAGGALVLVGGTFMHVYIYMTEVPEGYERISFVELQPQEGDSMPMGMPNLPTELDGKRVFVKGYVHPGVADVGEIKKFILVPDMGTCCFGGQPALTDMIEVTIKGKRGLRYTRRKRKLAGTFHVAYRLKQVAGGLKGGYYSLEADYVR